MGRQAVDVGRVRETILGALRSSPDGTRLTRLQLTDIVWKDEWARGNQLKRQTAGRIVRRVIAALVCEGHPIGSGGRGFKLLTGSREIERAAAMLESAAEKLLQRARALRGGLQGRLPIPENADDLPGRLYDRAPSGISTPPDHEIADPGANSHNLLAMEG